MKEIFIIYHTEYNSYTEHDENEIKYIVETEEEAQNFVDAQLQKAYEFDHKSALTNAEMIRAQVNIYDTLSPEAQRILFPGGSPINNKWQLERANQTFQQWRTANYSNLRWTYDKYKIGIPDGK